MTSVVIPVYADGSALRENLPRMSRLPGEKELIVADGGESDAVAVAAESPGVRVVAAGGGRGPQMNAGAAVARGERLLFLHADSWLDDDSLDEAARCLADRSVGAVVFRQHIEGSRRAYRWIERFAAFRARVLRCPYGDSGLVVRRADFQRIGGFPPLPLCEDLAMARRLVSLGRIAIAQSRVHLSARRWERNGIVRTTLLNAWIAAAFRVGVPPARLYSIYYRRPVRGQP